MTLLKYLWYLVPSFTFKNLKDLDALDKPDCSEYKCPDKLEKLKKQKENDAHVVVEKNVFWMGKFIRQHQK